MPDEAVRVYGTAPVTNRGMRRRKRVAEGRRLRAGGRARMPQRGDGWRVTDADVQFLAAATRYGVMTYRQARDFFYNGNGDRAVRRISRMRESGWVTQHRSDEWAGRVLMPTAAGSNIAGRVLSLPINAPMQHPGERLLHRLAVTDLGLQLTRNGALLLTEREVRTLEPSGIAAASRHDVNDVLTRMGLDTSVLRDLPVDKDGVRRTLAAVNGDKDRRLHYPDLIAVTPSRLTAIEVELNPKVDHRLMSILRGFRDSAFTHVTYVTTREVHDQLVGHTRTPSPNQTVWVEGLLQRAGLADGGGAPEVYTAEARVRVLPCTPHDDGVAYRLDMRQLPESMPLTKAQWRVARAQWREEVKPGGQPYLAWLRDHYRFIDFDAPTDTTT